MECAQGYTYCYPKGKSTKVPFTLMKPEEEEEVSSAMKTTPETAPTPVTGATAEPGPSTT